jgi:hypothetical protein
MVHTANLTLTHYLRQLLICFSKEFGKRNNIEPNEAAEQNKKQTYTQRETIREERK